MLNRLLNDEPAEDQTLVVAKAVLKERHVRKRRTDKPLNEGEQIAQAMMDDFSALAAATGWNDENLGGAIGCPNVDPQSWRQSDLSTLRRSGSVVGLIVSMVEAVVADPGSLTRLDKGQNARDRSRAAAREVVALTVEAISRAGGSPSIAQGVLDMLGVVDQVRSNDSGVALQAVREATRSRVRQFALVEDTFAGDDPGDVVTIKVGDALTSSLGEFDELAQTS